MIGARAFIAMSCTLMIFCACVSRERAAEHGEVLGEQVDRAAVDRAPAGDDAVAGDLGLLHAEVVAAVLDEHVELLERALVEQQFDALARGQLAALVLGLDARLAAAQAGVLPPLLEFVENVFHGPFSPCPYSHTAHLRSKSHTTQPLCCRPGRDASGAGKPAAAVHFCTEPQ